MLKKGGDLRKCLMRKLTTHTGHKWRKTWVSLCQYNVIDHLPHSPHTHQIQELKTRASLCQYNVIDHLPHSPHTHQIQELKTWASLCQYNVIDHICHPRSPCPLDTKTENMRKSLISVSVWPTTHTGFKWTKIPKILNPGFIVIPME